MPGPAFEVIERFGAVEDDQRCSKLIDTFADDARFIDPVCST
jgi:hypothetical protein